MAIKISLLATKKNIEDAVKTWLDYLSDEKYTDAFEFTVHDPYYQWTPLLLEQVVNGYGLPYENDGSPKCKVTKWLTATTEGQSTYYKKIDFFENPNKHKDTRFKWVGDISYDLPIDGAWSDLTATFKILQAVDYLTLELNEIHVM